MRKFNLWVLLIPLSLVISCASNPTVDYEKIKEHNKKIEDEVFGLGIKDVISGIPDYKVDEYMFLLKRELYNLKISFIQGIANESNVVTMILNPTQLFPDNSYLFHVKAYSQLDQIAKLLNRFPQTMIFITGNNYTLESGLQNNLTEIRAIILGDILVQRGVNKIRIFSIGLDNYDPAPFLDIMAGQLHIVIIPIVI